jgi:hypothetical protein
VSYLFRATSLLALVLMTCAPTRAWAQADASVSPADIQRLQDRVYSLSSDLSRLRSRDSSQASRLESDLDDLRDEVIYLKVKLRKESRGVPRSEYADLRDRLDSLGARIRGDADSTSTSRSTAPSSAAPPIDRQPDRTVSGRATDPDIEPTTRRPSEPTPAPTYDDRTSRSTSSSRRGGREIPVGQELDIRLQTPLNSETAQVEDRFEATTIVDLYEGDQMLVPAGSVLRGVVSSVKKAGRLERKGQLTLSFDQMTVNGRDYPIRATVTQAIESSGVRGEAGKIGTAAGVGAIIGGILGGFKGALAGILIGGGGTIAATEGNDVKLDTGTILRIRFDSPVELEPSSSSSYRR